MQIKSPAASWRLHIESMCIAFGCMVTGLLIGGHHILLQLGNLELIYSDRLQRGAAGGASVMIAGMIFWYAGKGREYRRQAMKLSYGYLALYAAAVLAAAVPAAGSVYCSQAFQAWCDGYKLLYSWSFYGFITDSVKTVVSGIFITGLLTALVTAFGANYIIPKMNIRISLVKTPRSDEK